MAEHKPQYNLYTTTESGGSRKFTETHPKLSATESDFANAKNALRDGYGCTLTEATLQSETTVYTYDG